jgi:hypothetical protein
MKNLFAALAFMGLLGAVPAMAFGTSSFNGSDFGEVSTSFGSPTDNVGCRCVRMVAAGDNTDQTCNVRVKEMVNAAIQRSQMNGVGGQMQQLFNSGAHSASGVQQPFATP